MEDSEVAPSPIVRVPSAASTETNSKNTKINLRATIRFGQQLMSLPGGKVLFGVRRGELKLKLENGKMPLECMGLVVPFEPSVEVEEQQELGQETEGNVGVTPTIKSRGSSRNSKKAKYKNYRIANLGTEANPSWKFEAIAGLDVILAGQLTQELLGTVEINDQPCNIRATFEIRGQCDLYLFDVEGILKARNLSRNKTALLTREFFLRLIGPQLQPYLSQVEVQL